MKERMANEKRGEKKRLHRIVKSKRVPKHNQSPVMIHKGHHIWSVVVVGLSDEQALTSRWRHVLYMHTAQSHKPSNTTADDTPSLIFRQSDWSPVFHTNQTLGAASYICIKRCFHSTCMAFFLWAVLYVHSNWPRHMNLPLHQTNYLNLMHETSPRTEMFVALSSCLVAHCWLKVI